jgi:hypothetical protein
VKPSDPLPAFDTVSRAGGPAGCPATPVNVNPLCESESLDEVLLIANVTGTTMVAEPETIVIVPE